MSYSRVKSRSALSGASPAMKQSLRKTPTQLHLAYKYGDGSERLVGRNLSLLQDGILLTITIDLSPNFQLRNKTSTAYLDAINLMHNHHKLRSLQCGDNLVRARLLRAWEDVADPQLRMCLELGQRGRFLYSVQPHSLFTGGIQLDVEAVLDEDTRPSRPLPPHQLNNSRSQT